MDDKDGLHVSNEVMQSNGNEDDETEHDGVLGPEFRPSFVDDYESTSVTRKSSHIPNPAVNNSSSTETPLETDEEKHLQELKILKERLLERQFQRKQQDKSHEQTLSLKDSSHRVSDYSKPLDGMVNSDISSIQKFGDKGGHETNLAARQPASWSISDATHDDSAKINDVGFSLPNFENTLIDLQAVYISSPNRSDMYLQPPRAAIQSKTSNFSSAETVIGNDTISSVDVVSLEINILSKQLDELETQFSAETCVLCDHQLRLQENQEESKQILAKIELKESELNELKKVLEDVDKKVHSTNAIISVLISSVRDKKNSLDRLRTEINNKRRLLLSDQHNYMGNSKETPSYHAPVLVKERESEYAMSDRKGYHSSPNERRREERNRRNEDQEFGRRNRHRTKSPDPYRDEDSFKSHHRSQSPVVKNDLVGVHSERLKLLSSNREDDKKDVKQSTHHYDSRLKSDSSVKHDIAEAKYGKVNGERLELDSDLPCLSYNTGRCTRKCTQPHICVYCGRSGHGWRYCRMVTSICLMFNRNIKCDYNTCNRIHVCLMCHGDHALVDCQFRLGVHETQEYCQNWNATGNCTSVTCVRTHRCMFCDDPHPSVHCAHAAKMYLNRPFLFTHSSDRKFIHSSKPDTRKEEESPVRSKQDRTREDFSNRYDRPHEINITEKHDRDARKRVRDEEIRNGHRQHDVNVEYFESYEEDTRKKTRDEYDFGKSTIYDIREKGYAQGFDSSKKINPDFHEKGQQNEKEIKGERNIEYGREKFREYGRNKEYTTRDRDYNYDREKMGEKREEREAEESDRKKIKVEEQTYYKRSGYMHEDMNGGYNDYGFLDSEENEAMMMARKRRTEEHRDMLVAKLQMHRTDLKSLEEREGYQPQNIQSATRAASLLSSLASSLGSGNPNSPLLNKDTSGTFSSNGVDRGYGIVGASEAIRSAPEAEYGNMNGEILRNNVTRAYESGETFKEQYYPSGGSGVVTEEVENSGGLERTCHSWNSTGYCRFKSTCWYAHVCSVCRNPDHRVANCPKKAVGAVAEQLNGDYST